MKKLLTITACVSGLTQKSNSQSMAATEKKKKKTNETVVHDKREEVLKEARARAPPHVATGSDLGLRPCRHPH